MGDEALVIPTHARLVSFDMSILKARDDAVLSPSTPEPFQFSFVFFLFLPTGWMNVYLDNQHHIPIFFFFTVEREPRL